MTSAMIGNRIYQKRSAIMQRIPCRKFVLFTAGILLLSLTACQIIHRTPPEEAVRLRITDFMNARVSQDFAKAYTFFNAVYHDTVSATQYEKKAGRVAVSGFSIESIDVNDSGKEAVAVVKTDVSMQGFDFKDNSETQIWVREKGGWFLHIPEKNPEDFFQ